MIYPWFEFSGILRDFVPEMFDIELSVLSNDEYALNGSVRCGASGKTCWYVPLARQESRIFGLNGFDVGLKVIKYPVYNDIKDEYLRLLREFTIQKILFAHGMAPDVFKLVLVRNAKANFSFWLGQNVEYPSGAVFFALLVANVVNREPLCGVTINAGGNLFGPKIDEFRERCHQLRIEPYDLTTENMYQSDDRLGVLDVHKWRRTYEIRNVKTPKYLQIELNNTCNARCCMCAIPHMTRPKGNMTDELFEKIIVEANALGIEYITPFLHGEPFMREDFVEKLQRINVCAPRMKITIFTNASLLTERNVMVLAGIKNVEQIVLSFPGGNKKTYEATTGLDFETTVRNIKRAFEVLRGKKLRISMPKCTQNQKSEDDFASLWKGLPKRAYNTYNYLGDVQGSLAQSCFEQCDRAFRTMTVLFDGRVCLCCMDVDGKYIMGDLAKESIVDVWNGEKFVKLRTDHGCCRLACEPCNRCTQDLKTEEYNDAYHSSLV